MGNEEAKLFVAGLPDSMSEDGLRQLFEATGGKVMNVSLPKDRATGRPRGFGFVTLSTPEEAQSAREALDGSLQAGKSISVRPFQAEPPRRDGAAGPSSGPPRSKGPGRANEDERKIYVGNLPYDCSQQDIEQLVNNAAGEAGTVAHVSLPAGPDGRKKGFGFVLMTTVDAAKAAVTALQSATMRGRPLKVNMAQPKADRPPGAGYAGAGGGGGGYGGGGFGGPPMGFPGSAPLPPRKTFDERKRKTGGQAGEDGAPRRRNAREERTDRKDDWYDDDKD